MAFSLNTLLATETTMTSAAPAPASGGPARQAGSADQSESGLIDLNALMSRPGGVADHLAVYPLGDPTVPPPAGEQAPAPAPPPRRRSRWLPGAVLAAGLAVAGGFTVGAGSSQASPPAATVGLAGVARSLEARLAASQASEVAARAQAEPPPAAEAEQPAAPSAGPIGASVHRVASAGRSRAANGSTGAGPKTTKPPAGPQKSAPAKDPCGGDLLCAMRRAAER